MQNFDNIIAGNTKIIVEASLENKQSQFHKADIFIFGVFLYDTVEPVRWLSLPTQE